MTSSPKPKRRWLQFSMRSLLVFVLLVSLSLGWWVNSAERQRRAAKEIERLGGQVMYDSQNKDSRVPEWLRKMLPRDMYANVVAVDVGFDHRPFDPHSIFPLLKAFPNIYQVAVVSDRVTNEDVSHLAGLTHLGYLHLESKLVTDKSIDTLVQFREINNLSLSTTSITKQGYARLRAAYPSWSMINSRNAADEKADEAARKKWDTQLEQWKKSGVIK